MTKKTVIKHRYFAPIILIIVSIFIASCSKKEGVVIEDIYTIGNAANANYRTLRDSSSYYWRLIKPFKDELLNDDQQFILKKIEARHYQSLMVFDSASIYYEQAAQLTSKNRQQQVTLLTTAGKTALYAKQIERYRILLGKATNIAKGASDASLTGKVAGLEGEFALIKKEYDQAISCFERALLNDTINQGLYLYKLGLTHLRNEEAAVALECLLKSEAICIKEGNISLLVSIDNRIVKLYRKIERYNAALEKQKEILEISYFHNFQFATYNGLNQMGIIYSELKMWDKADEYFQKTLAQAYLMDRPKSIAITLNNIGKFHLYRKNLEKAEEFYLKAYQYRLMNNIGGQGLLNSVWNLGDLYENQKIYSKAEVFLLQAVNMSDSIDDLSMSSISHKKLADLYQGMGETEKFVEQLTIYTQKEKELVTRNASNHLQETLVKYETNEKQLLIVQQEQELSAKNKINILLGCVALFLAALIILIARLYVVKMKNFRILYKQQNKIDIQKRTINKLLKSKAKKTEQTSHQELLKNLLIQLEDSKIYKDPKVSLNSLSQILATNTSYLSGLINSEFKCNFKTLINRYRIDYCKAEMCNNRNNTILIKQIAMEAGFSSLSNFHTIFKKEIGLTPSRYQELSRKQSEKIKD